MTLSTVFLIASALALFTGWFGRKSWAWFAIWFLIGGSICIPFLISSWEATPSDLGWGRLIGQAFCISWGLGGAIQSARLVMKPS